MESPRSTATVVAKVAVAACSIAAIFGVAGRNLAPHVAVSTWLLWCLGGALSVLVLATAFVAAVLPFREYLLRKGAIDVDWLWFRTEPRGLMRMRGQHEAPPASDQL